MFYFFHFSLSGIFLGAIYAIIALGIVIIYKSTKVFNFAQGHLLMVAVLLSATISPIFGIIAWDQRICTDVMRAVPKKVFAKTGVEGSYGLRLIDRGIGIAVKIEDRNPRALNPVVVEILNGEALEILRPCGPKTSIYNHRKDLAGEIEPIFQPKGMG